MRRPHEIEIKLKVRNWRTLSRRLSDLGFERLARRHFESNLLLDFKDSRLRKARCLLRLRSVGGRVLLTFKTAPLRSRNYKIRGEIETEVRDGRALRRLFSKVGLRETFRYEKYRTIFVNRRWRKASDRSLVVYDETPIGDYLELEGSKRWIDRVACELGYGRREYITASYGALYRQHCRERGRRPKDMVFSAHK